MINKRSVLALLDQSVVSATSLLTTIIVGRYCGSEELGRFSLGISVLVLANGMQTSLVSTPYTVFRTRMRGRLSPALHAGGSLAGALLLGALLTVLASLVAATISVYGDAWPVKVLSWTLVTTVPWFLAREFTRRFDFSHLNMGSAIFTDAGVAILQVTSLFLLAFHGYLTSSTAFISIGASCAVMVTVWALRWRTEFTIARGKIATAITHDWRFGRWLCAGHLICLSQAYVMHWLLTFLISPSATGVFTACLSIAALASPFLQAVGNYLSPRFAETVASRSQKDTLRLYWRASLVLCIGVSTFIVVAAVFGRELLWLLYRDSGYSDYGVVVALLALRMGCSIPALAADHAIVAMESPRGSAFATLTGLGTTICLALPMISMYEIKGAAIAMLGGTIVESLVLLCFFGYCLHVCEWDDRGQPAASRSTRDDRSPDMMGRRR
ncbi:MAG: hypothetical protein WD049_01730 [Candidatus Paceibacterota bacterium]